MTYVPLIAVGSSSFSFHRHTLYLLYIEFVCSLLLLLGSKITSLDVIKSINRFLEPPLSGPMCDLLWADPLLEEVLGKRMSDKDYKEVS